MVRSPASQVVTRLGRGRPLGGLRLHGPSIRGRARADRWLREFGHENVDAFRDAIPFSETREYVRIVLRNAAVYSELYDISAEDPARP